MFYYYFYGIIHWAYFLYPIEIVLFSLFNCFFLVISFLPQDWPNEDREHFSPISVLDCPFEDDDDGEEEISSASDYGFGSKTLRHELYTLRLCIVE